MTAHLFLVLRGMQAQLSVPLPRAPISCQGYWLLYLEWDCPVMVSGLQTSGLVNSGMLHEKSISQRSVKGSSQPLAGSSSARYQSKPHRKFRDVPRACSQLQCLPTPSLGCQQRTRLELGLWKSTKGKAGAAPSHAH